ncbi:hypothetical protein PU634_05110 [Oceanimonas pelagia]|uniref:SWIM-type domain-containing protein n=1 Tax=Oceanimonas pelagia TaxID=3028314 RepID=A0AA50KRQ1_9GAMM|nr:hypothetical protein [Oceanimonas pelagia]WMC11747.1 hypothetical protein PU634_05110 [Oceanimonas pelagia]
MAEDIGSLKGISAEVRQLVRADAQRRREAKNILSPKGLQGNYDAGELLHTTLGGEIRPLTSDDLAAFRQNARSLGRRFKGGITPRQVIDMSLAVDRKKARQEITVAVPASARTVRGAGRSADSLEVRFVTNASKKHGTYRHFVTVQFLGYPTAIASGALTPAKAASQMRKEGIRFDCDCGRHTYWYRYIATVGNYNAGRAENGYPKIRNPNLAGVACKHVLRVMAEVEGSSVVQNFLERAIAKGRERMDGTSTIRTSDKAASKIIQKQALRPTTHGGRTGDRDYDRARRALRQQSRATTTRPTKVASGSKRVSALAGDPKAEAALMGVVQQLGISREQAIAILQGVK